MNARDVTNRPQPRFARRFSENHKILLVEDESVVAWDLEELLREHGAKTIISCAAVAEAREILSSHSDISCVILDLKLRDGFGGDLIGEMRARGIPVIVSTGYSGFESGGVPVLLKPYSSNVLLHAVFAELERSTTLPSAGGPRSASPG